MEEPFNDFFKLTKDNFRKYGNASIHFSNIRIVGYYERQWKNITSAKRIRYFVTPSVEMFPIDLNVGYKEYISTGDYSKHVDLCLSHAIIDQGLIKEDRTKVFTRSGTLAHIMNSIHHGGDHMSIRVSRYNGNIYITTDNPNEPKEVNEDFVSVESPVETHHNQIKRYLFADKPNEMPDIKKPWNENIEFLGVFQSDFDKFDIIYKGSIHAIMADEEFINFDNMDEFNKCRFVFVKQMWENIRYKNKKLLRYLYFAYLTKVNDIYVAYKDTNGVVKEPLEHILVSKFPNHFFKKLWISEAFLLDLLQRIEKLMSNINCLDTVYVIRKNGDNIYYKKYEGKTNKSFIPQFYQDHVENKGNT